MAYAPPSGKYLDIDFAGAYAPPFGRYVAFELGSGYPEDTQFISTVVIGDTAEFGTTRISNWLQDVFLAGESYAAFGTLYTWRNLRQFLLLPSLQFEQLVSEYTRGKFDLRLRVERLGVSSPHVDSIAPPDAFGYPGVNNVQHVITQLNCCCGGQGKPGRPSVSHA